MAPEVRHEPSRQIDTYKPKMLSPCRQCFKLHPTQCLHRHTDMSAPVEVDQVYFGDSLDTNLGVDSVRGSRL